MRDRAELRSAAAWAARAFAPPAVTSIRDSLAFGHDHGLSSAAHTWIFEYRRAFRFGLHYLPSGFGLNGLVLDVGANRGDFTACIRRLEPRSRVLAFEPAAGPRAVLSERFAADLRVAIDDRALSEQNGTAVFHETEVSEFASLLPIRNMPVVGKTNVRTIRLDDLVTSPVHLLKIDVQGHEVSVLRGAANTLQSTRAVLVEVLFTSLYEGDVLFATLDRIMDDAGFTLAGLGEPRRHQGRVTWSDACYVRS